MQRAGQVGEFSDGMFFPAQLDKIDIAFNHRLRHTLGVSNVDVTEIQDSVEAAIA